MTNPQVRGATAALETHLRGWGGAPLQWRGGAGSKSIGTAARPQPGSGRRGTKQTPPPQRHRPLLSPKVGVTPRQVPQEPPGTPRHSPRGAQTMTMLASARWGHRCEDAWVSPRESLGTRVQGGGALSPRKGGPGRGGHLSLPRTAAKQLPRPSHEQRWRDFFFLFHCEFIFFFFFFLLKPKTGWRLASRAGTSLPGTSAIPRGCGAGAGPTDASQAWWGQSRGGQGRAWGGHGLLGLAPGPLFGISKHPHNNSRRRVWGNGRGKNLDQLCPDPQQMQAGPPPCAPTHETRSNPGRLPPPGISSPKNWARNGSGCCKDLSYKRGAPSCPPAPPCPAGPHG